MNIRITTKNVNLTPELRNLVENKVSRLKKYFDRIQETYISLEQAKYGNEVEIVVRTDLMTVAGSQSNPDLRTALDASINKVEKQIRRQKEKLYRSKKHQKRTRDQTTQE